MTAGLFGMAVMIGVVVWLYVNAEEDVNRAARSYESDAYTEEGE